MVGGAFGASSSGWNILGNVEILGPTKYLTNDMPKNKNLKGCMLHNLQVQLKSRYLFA